MLEEGLKTFYSVYLLLLLGFGLETYAYTHIKLYVGEARAWALVVNEMFVHLCNTLIL